MVTELILPAFFRELELRPSEVHTTGDGFFAATKSIAQILADRGITTFPNDRDEERRCDKFYDDWYLYAVGAESDFVYSLFKMREQEHDAAEGIIADGDIPGATVSFIALKTEILTACLNAPSHDNRKAFNRELNRVVAAQKQRHDEALKAYFIRPQAKAPYLIARLYTDFIASLSENGFIPVPEYYAAHKPKRLRLFLEENNASAGYTVCDHNKIHIRDPQQLTKHERLAILATHTANVSVHSFAAEVRFHALFLVHFPLGPIYESAIRADMTICDNELQGFTPYYRLNSRLVKQQAKYHEDP